MLVTDSAISAQKSSTSWFSLFKANTLTSSSGSFRSDRIPAVGGRQTPPQGPTSQGRERYKKQTNIPEEVVYIASSTTPAAQRVPSMHQPRSLWQNSGHMVVT